jgi:hypothetical protein
MNIGAVLEQQPYNTKIILIISVPLVLEHQMQWCRIVGIMGIRICTMLEKDPSSSHTSEFRYTMQRCPIIDVQGVRICTVLEEKPSNLFIFSLDVMESGYLCTGLSHLRHD